MTGQQHSRYQRGVIQRYYEHIDTIALQKLSEIVSDLYLEEGGKATRLWNNARQALAKIAPADDEHIMKVLSARSVTGLARLVTELSASAKARNTAQAPGDNPVLEVQKAPLPAQAQSKPETPPLTSVTSQETPATSAPPTSAAPTPDQLKHALKAFKKRLKLTKLDEESKLGRVGNPMSGGKKSQVVAIMAPREYPQAVWDELVKQGRLRKSGGSFYELVDGG
jgi:hypothetical protein